MKFTRTYLACLALGVFGGCVSPHESATVPAMTAPAGSSSQEAPTSDQAAESSLFKSKQGWYCLYQYSLTKKGRYLQDAGKLFNQGWKLNPENHYPQWGWGVIKGFQAELQTKNPAVALKLRLEAVDFLLKVQNKKVPLVELPALNLDLANAYNKLAESQLKQNQVQTAQKNLDAARDLLKSIDAPAPLQGRAYVHLAENCLLRKDKTQAREYATKAQKAKAELPKELKEQLAD